MERRVTIGSSRGDALSPGEAQRLVRAGYDQLAGTYLEGLCGPTDVRGHFIEKLLAEVLPGGRMLELGCGPGTPVTSVLARHGRVFALDISSTQLTLARLNAPQAVLLQADITEAEFRGSSFDAVFGFYVLTHVPRGLMAGLLERIRGWLRPGGMFLATMGFGDLPDSVEERWLGVPMFFSHYDAGTNLDLVRQAGFIRVESEVVTTEEDGRAVPFLWVTARVPAKEPTSGAKPLT